MNKEFEEKGYKLIDLNFGFEALISKAFEEEARRYKPDHGVYIAGPFGTIDIPMELMSAIIHRDYLTLIVEIETDLRLIPTYCYSRKYFKGSILKVHTDRDACEISLSYCISGPEWEMNMGDDTIITKIGNGVIYKGCEIPHGRSEPSSGEVIQVFNHWVISDGEKSNYAYDSDKNKNFYKGI